MAILPPGMEPKAEKVTKSMASDPARKLGKKFDFKNWLLDNIVTIIFWVFIIVGFMLAKGVTINWFLNELCNRFYRNAFLVLSLIIPVIAGLGLNFGIVVGAIAGQLAIIGVRYFDIGGIGGFWLCMLIALPIAVLFGWLTGTLYNKTRGQEMIASLIVGYFGNGVYMFIVLFLIGAVIPVRPGHPMILPGDVGVRMTVDMGSIKYALEDLVRVPFAYFIAACAALFLLYLIWSQFLRKLKPGQERLSLVKFILYAVLSAGILVLFIINIATKGPLTMVGKVPLMTILMVVLLAVFTKWLMTTKLGQDFRSCGQNQYIAESNGINVDRTRIIATIISTVLAAWGMIIYLENMGTLNVYTAHTQIGFFAVAAILVGGASVSKATISQAIMGTLLFQSMFILSPEIGQAVFGQAILGEYFRTFMVYGVIGLALGLYVWKAYKQSKLRLDPEEGGEFSEKVQKQAKRH